MFDIEFEIAETSGGQLKVRTEYSTELFDADRIERLLDHFTAALAGGLAAPGQPNFDVKFYVLNRRGEHAGVSMYPGQYAVCTENGPETRPTEPLFPAQPKAS